MRLQKLTIRVKCLQHLAWELLPGICKALTTLQDLTIIMSKTEVGIYGFSQLLVIFI